MSNPPGPPVKWHEALAYAMTGQRVAGLGEQVRPNVPELAGELRLRNSRGEACLLETPALVPADLKVGLGAAQFWAALAALRHALDQQAPSAVTNSRSLTPEERRLDADRPPHH